MMHRRAGHGHETKYQTYRGKRRNEDYLIRAGAGGREVHNGHFTIKKGSRRCGFRRHRRAYSVRASGVRATGDEVKENEEMTGTKGEDEGERTRERRKEEKGRARAGRRDGEGRE